MYDKNPVLAWNYISFSIFRLYEANHNIQNGSPSWYTYTAFYKKWADTSLRPMILLSTTLMKLFYFALLMPFLVALIPLPDFSLNTVAAKTYVANENAPYGPVILTKMMFLYFGSLAAYEVFERIFKFLTEKPQKIHS